MTFIIIYVGQAVDAIPADVTELTIPFDTLVTHKAQLSKLSKLEILNIGRPHQATPQGRPLASRMWRCELPDEVCKIPKLRILRVDHIGLETLPAGFENHPTLEHLLITGARFTTLVDWTKKLDATISLEHGRLSAAEQRWLDEVGELPKAERLTAPPPKPRKSKAIGRRLAQPAWDAVEMLAVSADGATLYAGQRGAFGACAWDIASGKLLWTRSLSTDEPDIEGHTSISVAPSGELLATYSLAAAGMTFIDAATGKTQRTENTISFPRHQIGNAGSAQYLLPLLHTLFHTGVFEYPSLAPSFVADGPIANLSADGTVACLASRDTEQIRVYKVDALVAKKPPFATLAVDPQHPHAMTPNAKIVVVLGEELEAEVFDIAKQKRTAKYCWAPDIKAAKTKGSIEPSRPAFDPQGARMAIVRRAHKGKLAHTIGVLEVASGKQLVVLPAHARLPDRMDPTWGALYTPEWNAHPALLWIDDDTLAVGSVMRDDAEPCAGTGVTLHVLK